MSFWTTFGHAGATSSSRPRLGRRFTALWIVQSVSTVGDGLRIAALPLLAASLTRDATTVALVSFAGQLPWLVMSLVSGALGDSDNRVRLMWGVDAARGLVLTALVVSIWADIHTIPLLCVVAFLLGSGQTLFDNASHAVLPAIVERGQLAPANSRLLTVRSAIGDLLGPPLGSALFTLGAALPFLTDGLTFALAAVIAGLALQGSGNVERDPDGEKRPALITLIKEGIGWVVRHPVMRLLEFVIAIVNLTQSATQSILVLFALEELDIPESLYGLLLAASGVGALCGGMLAGWMRRWIRPPELFVSTVVLTVPIFLVIAASTSGWVVGIMLGLNAAAGITANILMRSLRQMIVPEQLLARVNSVIGFFAGGVGLPLGTLIGGAVAESWGLRAPFLLSAAVSAASLAALPRLAREMRAFEADLRH